MSVWKRLVAAGKVDSAFEIIAVVAMIGAVLYFYFR
jgi:hypothetical protein